MFVVLLIALVYGAPPIWIDLIEMQSHSCNDVGAWQAAVQKGMQYLKIDPHWVPPEDLTNHPRGALFLSHDPPTLHAGHNYATTDDVIKFLNATSLYFRNPVDRCFVTLSFKGAPDPCIETKESENWLFLVDDFFLKANAVIKHFDLNLEFILDGDATWAGKPCLADRWSPWVMTWLGDPPDAFTSNDKSLHLERFQQYVKNGLDAEHLGEFQNDLNQNFGKFQNNKYPYSVRKPDDENEFAEFSTVFMEWSNRTNNHKPMIFSTPLDPVMFELFTAPFEDSPYARYPVLEGRGQDPKTVVVKDFNLLIVLYKEFGLIRYAYYSLSEKACPHTPQRLPFCYLFEKSLDFPWIIDTTRFEVSSLSDWPYLIVVTDTHGQNFVFRIDAKKGLIYDRNLTTRDDPERFKQSISKPFPGSFVAELYIDSASPSCFLALQMWKTDPFSQRGPSHCFVREPMNITYFDVVMVPTRTRVECITEGIVIFSTMNQTLYGSVFCVFGNSTSASSQPRVIDVGERPQLQIWQVGNQWGLTMVHEYGFCYHSKKHNARSLPFCAQDPQPTKGVLSYNYGLWEDWAGFLLSPKQSYLTACNTLILHGTYDQGSTPTFDLLEMDGELSFMIIEAHNGLHPYDKDEGECGRPKSFFDQGGIVVNMWPMPHDWGTYTETKRKRVQRPWE